MRVCLLTKKIRRRKYDKNGFESGFHKYVSFKHYLGCIMLYVCEFHDIYKYSKYSTFYFSCLK